MTRHMKMNLTALPTNSSLVSIKIFISYNLIGQFKTSTEHDPIMKCCENKNMYFNKIALNTILHKKYSSRLYVFYTQYTNITEIIF